MLCIARLTAFTLLRRTSRPVVLRATFSSLCSSYPHPRDPVVCGSRNPLWVDDLPTRSRGAHAVMQRRRYTQWAGHFPPGQADFSARDEFEMFHRIGDVDLVAVDADFFQRPVEHLPVRSDEWLAGKVLLVAGLLADQHHLGSLRTFAEHR